MKMPHYKCDPHWITVKFESSCLRCKRSIHPGEPAFYYPRERSFYCEAEGCGREASRDISARVFDEENNTSM
jgi:hypothetical protein